MDNSVVCRCTKLCDQLGLTLRLISWVGARKGRNFKTNKTNVKWAKTKVSYETIMNDSMLSFSLVQKIPGECENTAETMGTVECGGNMKLANYPPLDPHLLSWPLYI